MSKTSRKKYSKNGYKMEINSTIKTEDGVYQFKGELTQDEMDVVVQAGLNVLLQQGAIPFLVRDEEEEANLVVREKSKRKTDD